MVEMQNTLHPQAHVSVKSTLCEIAWETFREDIIQMKKIPKKKERPGLDRYGRNDLINAVIDDNIEDIKAILKTKVDINLQDDNGWTALHFAAQSFNEAVILALLKAKANPNLQNDYGNTPLFVALFNSQGQKTKIFDQFQKSGADPKLKNNSDISPLDLAETVANFDLKQYFPKYFPK